MRAYPQPTSVKVMTHYFQLVLEGKNIILFASSLPDIIHSLKNVFIITGEIHNKDVFYRRNLVHIWIVHCRLVVLRANLE